MQVRVEEDPTQFGKCGCGCHYLYHRGVVE